MARGPKPKPKASLQLSGTYRQDRHGNSPNATNNVPEIPKWITGRAAEMWSDISVILEPMGLLSRDYTVGMALLVDSLADWVATCRKLAEE
mgnify:CR=1 FL=1